MELRSLFDTLSDLGDYTHNGDELGWLINPQAKQVKIYRLGQDEVEVLFSPTSLSGEDVLPGFLMI
jgi:hypothetical protein